MTTLKSQFISGLRQSCSDLPPLPFRAENWLVSILNAEFSDLRAAPDRMAFAELLTAALARNEVSDPNVDPETLRSVDHFLATAGDAFYRAFLQIDEGDPSVLRMVQVHGDAGPGELRNAIRGLVPAVKGGMFGNRFIRDLRAAHPEFPSLSSTISIRVNPCASMLQRAAVPRIG